MSQNEHLNAYLLEKINESQTIERDPDSADVGFFGQAQIASAEQDEFKQLGDMLVKRMTKSWKNTNPTLFEILDLTNQNAYAMWPAQCFAVLPTAGLIDQIQKICGQAAGLLDRGLDIDYELTRLWKDLPRDQEHREAFGQILAQTAYSFIVHHEIAHLGLGHEYIYPARDSAAASGTLDSGEHAVQSIECINESLAISASNAVSSAGADADRLDQQAIETDADINGFMYTREFLLLQAERFRALDAPDRDSSKDAIFVVWKRLLNDPQALRVICLAGAFIALLSFIRNKESISDVATKTHPLPSMRILALLHFEGQNQKQIDKNGGVCLPALHIGVSLYAYIIMAAGAFSAWKEGNLTPVQLQKTSMHSVLEDSGLLGAIENLDTVAAHYRTLSACMARLHPKRVHYCRQPDFLRCKWF